MLCNLAKMYSEELPRIAPQPYQACSTRATRGERTPCILDVSPAFLGGVLNFFRSTCETESRRMSEPAVSPYSLPEPFFDELVGFCLRTLAPKEVCQVRSNLRSTCSTLAWRLREYPCFRYKRNVSEGSAYSIGALDCRRPSNSSLVGARPLSLVVDTPGWHSLATRGVDLEDVEEVIVDCQKFDINRLHGLPSLRHLELGPAFDSILRPRSLPGVTTLVFGFFYDEPLLPAAIPATVTTLRFGPCFNQSLDQDTLPCGLTTLVLGTFFNRFLDLSRLTRLRRLVLGTLFDYSLEDRLPSSLEELVLRCRYRHALPSSPSCQVRVLRNDFDGSTFEADTSET